MALHPVKLLWSKNDSITKILVGLLSEFVGTMLLVSFGCAMAFNSFRFGQELGPHSFAGAGLSFAVVVGLVVYMFSSAFPHATAHVNPAVTLAAVIAGQASLVRAILYVVFQCAGGVAGAAILYACIPTMRAEHFPCTTLSGVSIEQGLGLEILATFILVLGAFSAGRAVNNRVWGPLVVALWITVIITILIMTIGPYTGASMNPARSLGPAVIFGGDCWKNHWVYWAATLLGGCLGAITFKLLTVTDKSNNDSRRDSGQTVESVA